MDQPGGDCPCKRKRISENTDIDAETGMLIDLPQHRENISSSAGTGSVHGELRRDNILFAAGDAGTSNNSGANVKFSYSKQTCEDTGLADSLDLHSSDDVIIENQPEDDLSAGLAPRVYQPEQTTRNYEGKPPNQHLEPVIIKTGRQTNTNTCEYVQTIQAVAENSFMKTRDSVCIVSSNTELETDKEHLSENSEQRQSVENLAADSHSVLGRSLNRHEQRQSVDNLAADRHSVLGRSFNRHVSEEIDLGLALADTQEENKLDAVTEKLSDNNQESSDNSLQSLLYMTRSKDTNRDNIIQTNSKSCREPEIVRSTYNLDDSGFIEMFSNSVMGSIMSNSGSSGYRLAPCTSQTQKNNGIYTASKTSEGTTENPINYSGDVCKFSGLLDVLDDTNSVKENISLNSSIICNKRASAAGACSTNSGNKTVKPSFHIKTSSAPCPVGNRVPVQRVQDAACSNCQINHDTDLEEKQCTCSKQPNELFKIDYEQTKLIISENGINQLPTVILINIFRNLLTYDLLCRASRVCKFWYNLCRDPDIWRNISLANQHRLKNENLMSLIRFSDHRVRKVNLTDCRFITSEGVRYLMMNCPLLESLRCMRCFDLTDAAFEGLSKNGVCKKLKCLHLDGCCRVTDKTVLELSEACPNLEDLHFNQCTKVSDASIMMLARKCPQMTSLQLDHCGQVTDDAISEIVMGCAEMTYLNLMSCAITDTGVRYLAKLSKLTNLDLSNIVRLTPDSVVYMSRFCKNLQCINISLNSVMDDGCVAKLASNLPALRKLYCVSCSISDTGLEDIGKYCPSLQALDVGWCQEVTDHGVRVISSCCKRLEYFGLIRCDRVTIETVEELVLQYPRINYSTFILESKRLMERARREGYLFGIPAERQPNKEFTVNN